MQKVSEIISLLLHPVFIIVYIFGLAVTVDPYIQFVMPPDRVRPMILILMINTVILPIAAILFLKYKGVVKSIYLSTPSERRIGILIIFAFYLITYILWRQLTLPHSFLSIFSAVLTSLALVFIVTPRFNISMHALAAGGLVGTLLGLFKAHAFIDIYALAGTLLILGLSATARLLLHAHTAREINWGAFVGILLFYFFVGSSYYF
jgi:hypothetical protein